MLLLNFIVKFFVATCVESNFKAKTFFPTDGWTEKISPTFFYVFFIVVVVVVTGSKSRRNKKNCAQQAPAEVGKWSVSF